MTTCFGTVRPGIPGAGHQLVIKKMTWTLCRCLVNDDDYFITIVINFIMLNLYLSKLNLVIPVMFQNNVKAPIVQESKTLKGSGSVSQKTGHHVNCSLKSPSIGFIAFILKSKNRIPFQ